MEVTEAYRRRKLKYRTDAEYRAMIVSRVCKREAEQRKDPLYKQLDNTRNAIVRVRDSYHARVAHAERLFARLEKLIAERDRLAAEWRAKKKANRV